jgi:hypothetical protein
LWIDLPPSIPNLPHLHFLYSYSLSDCKTVKQCLHFTLNISDVIIFTRILLFSSYDLGVTGEYDCDRVTGDRGRAEDGAEDGAEDKVAFLFFIIGGSTEVCFGFFISIEK